ncbi:major facilitator superfamily permease [Ligilactobacillus ruminis ATCC 25644]|nr:major facilitator superfamily permease [Ligilactobacillus ruminis ATCC 25644]
MFVFYLTCRTILQGVGTRMALPLAMHIILEYVPLERRGFMVGVFTMTT